MPSILGKIHWLVTNITPSEICAGDYLTQWMKLPAMTKSLTKLDVCIFHYYFKSLTAISN